jgi:hypothetical protein
MGISQRWQSSYRQSDSCSPHSALLHGGQRRIFAGFPSTPSIPQKSVVVVLQSRTKKRYLAIKKVVRPALFNPEIIVRRASLFSPRSSDIWGGLQAVLSRGLSSHLVCKSRPAHLLCFLSLHTASAVTVKTRCGLVLTAPARRVCTTHLWVCLRREDEPAERR